MNVARIESESYVFKPISLTSLSSEWITSTILWCALWGGGKQSDWIAVWHASCMGCLCLRTRTRWEAVTQQWHAGEGDGKGVRGIKISRENMKGATQEGVQLPSHGRQRAFFDDLKFSVWATRRWGAEELELQNVGKLASFRPAKILPTKAVCFLFFVLQYCNGLLPCWLLAQWAKSTKMTWCRRR